MRTRSSILSMAAVGLIVGGIAVEIAEAGKRNRKLGRRGSRAAATRGGIPAHPDQLQFSGLKYDPPARLDHRHQLSNGVVVYVVEDHALPLVDVVVTAKGGSFLDPTGKRGLASMVAGLMRSGGAGDRDASQLDEEADFLAVSLGVGGGKRESSASLNVLSKDLDAGLDLLFDVTRHPRFQQDRLDIMRKSRLQDLERRNDSTTSIEGREWFRLGYGPDHFESTMPTVASVSSVTQSDMRSFHSSLWHPGNFIIAVSGDTTPEKVLPMLEARFRGWSAGTPAPAPPAPNHVPPPGVFVVNKDDVNQTRVSIGHAGSTWDDPNAQAIEVMNHVLGGSGFTSRITKRVRSDEGLAYSAGSGFGLGRSYPRTFRAGFQSKNASVARGIAIVMEEMQRMQDEPISAEELQTAHDSFVEQFPRKFASASATASLFVDDELRGRPADWWEKYRDRIRAVTAEDVMRVSKEYLHPDKATVLCIGKIEEVMAGEADYPDYSLDAFATDAGILDIGLPDPKSLEYPHPPRPLQAMAPSSM